MLDIDIAPATFAAQYPGVVVLDYFGGTLDNGGERLTLKDIDGRIVCTVEYDDISPWPTTPDNGGHTLQLRPDFTPAMDTGDHVIVINADQIKMTGNKLEQKVYQSHSGFPGGLKEVPVKRRMETRPDLVIRDAIIGMLPKNKLRAHRAKKLRVYLDAKGLERHVAQNPQPLPL